MCSSSKHSCRKRFHITVCRLALLAVHRKIRISKMLVPRSAARILSSYEFQSRIRGCDTHLRYCHQHSSQRPWPSHHDRYLQQLPLLHRQVHFRFSLCNKCTNYQRLNPSSLSVLTSRACRFFRYRLAKWKKHAERSDEAWRSIPVSKKVRYAFSESEQAEIMIIVHTSTISLCRKSGNTAQCTCSV